MALVTVTTTNPKIPARSHAGRPARSWTWCCACCEVKALDALSRELGVEAHRLAAWRDDFLSGGREALKGRRPVCDEDRQLREAERKIGELTMEVEVWRRAAEKGGAAMPPAKRPT